MTARGARIVAGLTVALVLAACGSTVTDDVGRPLEGVTGELIVTRQRDLLDRGLINVLTSNDSDHDLQITDRELVADHFASGPAEPRVSTVAAGRRVALQVPFGSADDCRSTEPVSARLVVSYTIVGAGDEAGEEHRASIVLAGTEILDDIRAEQCAARRFDRAVETALTEAVVVDGAVAARLELRRVEGGSTFAFDGLSGTVLVAVDPGNALPVTLDDGQPAAAVPVAFVVNRCDPHAMAEVTKRFGLELDVSIDGAPARPVAVDVSGLTEQLETIVEQCRAESQD